MRGLIKLQYLLVSMVIVMVSVVGVAVEGSQEFDVRLFMDKNTYLLNSVPVEPIRMNIVLKNEGSADIITSGGFSSEPFYLYLTFVSPSGSGIMPNELITDGSEGANPPVFPVVDNEGQVQLLQMEPVEVLPGTSDANGAFTLTAEITDAHDLYTLVEAGNYSVKAVISLRIYPGISQVINGVNYAELEPVLFQGVIESNTVNFVLLNDGDEDGYLSDIDCDDTNAAVYPGAPELCDSFDNDCNVQIDEGLTFDVDSDGYSAPGSCSGTQDDCDDNDANIHTGAVEIANNEIDENCDGSDVPAVTDLSARAKSGKVQITWSHVDAASYNIYRSVGGGAYVFLSNTTSTYSTYPDSGLTNDIEYCYKVRSVDIHGIETADSNEACATPAERIRRR